MNDLLDIERTKYAQLLQEEPSFRNELLKTRIAREITIIERKINREKERANESDKCQNPYRFIRSVFQNLHRLWDYTNGRVYPIRQVSEKATRA